MLPSSSEMERGREIQSIPCISMCAHIYVCVYVHMPSSSEKERKRERDTEYI
jgi:hypothetical protein